MAVNKTIHKNHEYCGITKLSMASSERKYDLEDRLIGFAVLNIETVNNLPVDKVGNHLGQQLLRSGTSPALNYGEAMSAESRKDFIHKFKIVLKELRETMICIKILLKISYLNSDNQIGKECNELIAIFVKSLATAEENF